MIPSYVVDPGGIPGYKEATNLLVRPTQAPVYDTVLTYPKTTQGVIYTQGVDSKTINITTFMNGSDFNKLQALNNYLKGAKNSNKPNEIIVYDLYTPYCEEGSSRSRYKVPSTPLTEVTLTVPNKRFVYYIAYQGVVKIDSHEIKGLLYKVSLTFTEGTVLLASDEP